MNWFKQRHWGVFRALARLGAHAALTFLLPISASGQRSSASDFIGFADIEKMSVSQRQKVLPDIISVLAEVDRPQIIDGGYCVRGGHIAKVRSTPEFDANCQPRNQSKCAGGEVECAPWLNPEGRCVRPTAKQSATRLCWDGLSSAQQEAARLFLLDTSGLRRFVQMIQLVQRVCLSSRPPSSCEKLRKEKPRSTALRMLNLFLTEAFANEACSFNHRSGEFVGRNGQRARIIFGTHGIPSDVRAFWSRGDDAGPEDARRLIESHRQSLPEMRRNLRKLSQQLRHHQSAWVGAEASDDSIRRLGGLDGFMRDTQAQEQALRRMGLSSSEVEDALLALIDPGHLALYRHVRETGRRPEYRGLDNSRNPAERERGAIGENVRRDLMFQRHREAIDAGLPLETIQRLSAALALSGTDPMQGAQALDRLWREPPNPLTEAQSTALLNAAIATRAHGEGLGEAQRARDSVDTRRSQSMADAIHEQMSQSGSGVYHVGTFHRAGLIPRLIANCQGQGSSSQPIRGPSHRSGTAN